MKRYLLTLSIVLAACGSPRISTPTPESLRRFSYGIDASVSCPNFENTKDNIGFVETTQGELSVTPNKDKIPGVYMNAIAVKEVEWQEDSEYIYSGEFRKASGDLEQLEINIQLIKDHTEHMLELRWHLNPYSPLYETVDTRNGPDSPIKIADLKSDNNWHKFIIVTKYTSQPIAYILESVSIDGEKHSVNMSQTWTLPKDWAGSYAILLETTNLYGNCSPLSAFSGTSQWRNIDVTQRNLP